jgi:hypothetical protein
MIKKAYDRVYDPDTHHTNVVYLPWDVYVGINGRWQAFKSPGGEIETFLNYSVDLDLVSESYYGNKIEITVCGRQLRAIDRLMDRDIGVTWQQIESTTDIIYLKERMEQGFGLLEPDAFERGVLRGLDAIDNERISTFRRTHCGIGGFGQNSPKNDYEIHYRIEDL